jgi:hypothetical protein
MAADARAWLRTNLRRRSPIDQELPWLNFALIELLERRFGERPGGLAFEWGAGGSTCFLGRRAARVVTVEHDPAWAERVRSALRGMGLTNVELRHIPENDGSREAGPGVGPARPHKLARYRDYIGSIVEREGGPLDLVLVDGRARLECAAAARSEVGVGGWVVVDDVDKPGRYEALGELFPPRTWSRKLTVGPGPASGLRLVTAAVVFERRV